jgi:GAF domain-containing protein
VTHGELGLAGLAAMRLADASLEDIALTVAGLARSLQSCDGAGLRLVGTRGLDPSAFTDSRSQDLDELQQRLDDGPCHQCLRTGARHDLDPATPSTTWPSFTPVARSRGLVACAALPLRSPADLIGVLNLYSWRHTSFNGWDHDECAIFARHAGTGLTNAQSLARSAQSIDDLQRELATHDDAYAEACGVLMERHHQTLSAAQAQLAAAATATGGLAEAVRHVLGSLDEL